MRHKRILNYAEDHPDASVEQIAKEIPTATAELVELVFEKYGDPAAAGTDHVEDEAASEDSTVMVPNLESLSEAQRATLEAIAARPEATQQELAEELNVSAATICNRVNAIPGFEWKDRTAIVEQVLTTAPPQDTDNMTEEHTEQATRIDALSEDIEAIKRRLENGSKDQTTAVFDDPELVHKVVHACMESETIPEDEELAIIKQLVV